MELNQEALKKAFANYWQRKSNATSQSFEDGGHGVLGVPTEERFLTEFVKDYLNGVSGEPVKEVKRVEPYSFDHGGR